MTKSYRLSGQSNFHSLKSDNLSLIHQKGIGTQLCTKLFEELGKSSFHAIIVGIALPNETSVKLHENFGMKKVAHFEEVGFKLRRWIDMDYWELIKK